MGKWDDSGRELGELVGVGGVREWVGAVREWVGTVREWAN